MHPFDFMHNLLFQFYAVNPSKNSVNSDRRAGEGFSVAHDSVDCHAYSTDINFHGFVFVRTIMKDTAAGKYFH